MVIDVFTETQSTTRSAPTLATEGQYLGGREQGIRIILSAASGQTLSGGGSLKCYYFDPTLAEWIRSPNLDITLDSSHSGVRRVVFPDQAIFVPAGRILYATSGVTVSGGTTVDVQQEVFRK